MAALVILFLFLVHYNKDVGEEKKYEAIYYQHNDSRDKLRFRYMDVSLMFFMSIFMIFTPIGSIFILNLEDLLQHL